jgi:hypothetical protein
MLGGLLALGLVAILVLVRLLGGATASLSPASATATAEAHANATVVSGAQTAAAGTLATASAQATATATAFTDLLNQAHLLYRAQVPGPGCDHGGAQWQTNAPQHVLCLSDRLRLVGTASAPVAQTTVICAALPSGGFPAHYVLRTDVIGLQGASGAEIQGIGGNLSTTLTPTDVTFYDGSSDQPVGSGTIDGSATTHVLIVATAQQTFFVIDGTLVATYEGAPSPIQAIGLSVLTRGGSSAVQADFSNFTVSALP